MKENRTIDIKMNRLIVAALFCINRMRASFQRERPAPDSERFCAIILILLLRSIIENSSPGSNIYVCGPLGMIETTKDIAIELGLPNEKIKYELFKTDDEKNEDEAFEVQIHATGQIIQVNADQSIIEALEKAGLDPLYDCQRGDCGICQCEVISGTPDHRDIILTEEEKASNSIMQICVSRAKSKRLVIDI